MVDAKDELFCRLAMRLGHLNREDAVELIKAYRSEAVVGQGVGAFAVEQGWLDAEAVGQIEHAIAARAPGHVSNVRKRVPRVGKGKGGKTGGKHPVQHHHHVPAYPQKVNASGLQVAVIGVAAVVLIGVVLFMIFALQESDSVSTSEKIEQSMEDRQERAEERRRQQAEKAAQPAKASAKIVEEAPKETMAQIPPEQLETLKKSVASHIFTSKQWDDREPYKAVEFIEGKKEEMKALPDELLEPLDERLDELVFIVKATYEERFIDPLKAAKEAGDDEEVKALLLEVKEACGPEFHEKAAELVK